MKRAYPKKLRDRAQALHRRGETYAEIARRLGPSEATIAKWCNPQRAMTHRRACRRWNRRNAPTRCKRHERPAHGLEGECQECCRERHLVRLGLGSRWWNEGLPAKEIAKRLGMTPYSFADLVQKGREAGFPFPYRKDWSAPKYADQIAA